MYLTEKQLKEMGFKEIGQNVLISDKASIYGANKISIGSNVRIDDFCILSAGDGIYIGDYIHIGCYTALIGKGVIMIKDFADISSRVTILSSTSNADGEFLTNPMTPGASEYYITEPVLIEKYTIIFNGSLILPGVILREGSVVAAMSMVKKSIPSFEIWGGVPAKFIKERSNNLINHANEVYNKHNG